ncbi:hypothetical protein DID73_02075 [Candidatus Marinamargulisbacteria bacterium SCGC AG-343-K17]|nr:hypothetical protein DID73_02075 [Candidatus Marinamargulisbacteria bacterium SCGC AG-343-K17]
MNRLVTFLVIFTFWLFWSGMFDAFHIILGLISSAIVVKWTGHLFVESKQSFSRRIREWLRFEVYSLWLLWQIIMANIQVFKLAFHPNLFNVLNPKLVTFNTSLEGDVAKFIFAQSITLTPGTVTVSIQGNEFRVHAINNEAASGVPGDMEKRVQAIYKGRQYG